MADLHIGIAGWSYADWKGVVYPPGCKDTLRFCAELVECIEINSTFYRIPTPQTCASWVKRTADLPMFFTAKLPRAFTHEGALEEGELGKLRDALQPMRDAGVLRMLLAQFSVHFTAEEQNLWHLARIVEACEPLAPVAVEVRHRSWTEGPAQEWLRGLPVSVVHLDYPGFQSGFGPWRTEMLGPSRIAYLRLHGRNYGNWFRKDAGRDAVYDYEYAPHEVEQLRHRIADIGEDAAATIVIANNHFHGQGMKVALELMALCEQRQVRVPDALIAAFPALRSIALPASRGLFE